MACDAQTLIALARRTDQYGKLSARDALLCLAAVYAFNGRGWEGATAVAHAKDYHRLSFRDLLMCLLEVLCGGGSGPAAPLTLTIASTSIAGSVVLNWTQGTAPDNNEIWVSKDLGFGVFSPYVLLATVAGATTTYSDVTGMGLHDFWVYKVRAVTGGQPSLFSPQAAISNFFNGHADFRTGCDQFFPVLYVELDTFDISSSVTRTALNLGVLKKVVGDFNTNSCPNLLSISAPALTTIGAGLEMQVLASVTSANFSSLITVGNAVQIVTCPGLTSLSIAALQTTGNDLFIKSTALPSISLTALLHVGTLHASSDFTVDNNASATSLSVPVLIDVDQTIEMTGNGFTALTFPVLHNFGEAFNISSNPALASISFGDLTGGFNDQWSVSLNAALVTLTAPNLIFPNNGINVSWNGNALNQASVDLVLHRCLVSGDNSNIIDLTGGTNSAPSLPCGNPASDCFALNAAGNTCTTN